MELPLSALVAVALFSLNLRLMDFINLVSGCAFSGGFCCLSLMIRLATCFL